MKDFNAYWPDVRIGDVFYVLGHSSPTKRDWNSVTRASWYTKLPKRYNSMPADINLPHVYNEHCYKNGGEPDWAKLLPTEVLRDLRRSWLMGDYFDPLAILLRYRDQLGFTCAIQSDGMIHDVCIALGVFRLDGIRQLGFLHDPVMNEAAADSGLAMRFEHTRYMHSLMVMATASLLGHKVGLSEHDLKHLQVAALTHDVLTPAGGDSVKAIDPHGLDEDAHYQKVFRDNPQWDEARTQYGLDESLLAATVRGEGMLGRLLDIADKTTYIAHDVEAYLMGDRDPRSHTGFVAPESIISIYDWKKHLGRGGCQLWDRCIIENGQVVITDIDRLVGFLTLRALMFRHLYYNPLARYREHMLAYLLLDPLYQEGVITRTELLQMNDADLEVFLSSLVGGISRYGRHAFTFVMELSDTRRSPEFEAYETREAAVERMRTLYRENQGLLFMLDVIPRVSEKAVRYLVRDADGEIKTLAEARPGDAETIRSIDADPLPAKLYILTSEKVDRLIPDDLLKKLHARQQALFGLE